MKLAELKEVSEEVFPSCTEDALDALERELKLNLPKSYRAVLLAQNGMLFSQRLCCPVPDEVDETLAILFGVGDPEDCYSVLFAQSAYDFLERVPPNVLPIGETRGQEKLCLSCAGVDTGSVYLWRPGLPWEEEEEDNVRTYLCLTLIAPSVDTFLTSLYLKQQ